MVVCWQCKRKTGFEEYRRLVVEWLDDVGGMIRQDLPEG